MTSHASSPAPHARTCAFHRCPASECPSGSHDLPVRLGACILFAFNLFLAFESLAWAARDALLAVRGALAVFAPVAAVTWSSLHIGSSAVTFGTLTVPLGPLVFVSGMAVIGAWRAARGSRETCN